MYVFNPFTGKLDAVTNPVEEPFTFLANCLSSDTVGKCVYVSSDAVGGVLQVTEVDPSNPSKMPAVGIILSKSSPTNCVVAFFGVISLPSLAPNARYFVDINAGLTSSVPLARPVIIQVLGQALDSGHLLLTPSKDLVRLNT